MKIFYIEKDKLLTKIPLEVLESYSDGRIYASKEKYIEHLCGLYLIKNIAKNYYKLENTDIEIINSKPYFKDGKLFFSLSHSKNVIAICFHNENVGLDIEHIQPRNYEKILKHYNKKIENLTDFEFYKFWTLLEAGIKLGDKPVSQFTTKFEDNYVLSCVSDNVIVSDFDIIKID